MPEICQNVKKQDYQGVEGKSIGIEVDKRLALILVNVNFRF